MRERLACSRNNGTYVPIKLYRSHCHNSLSVSDIQSGMWCESQLEYRYLFPHMKYTKQWKKQAKEGNEVQKKTPIMTMGSNIHQLRGTMMCSLHKKNAIKRHCKTRNLAMQGAAIEGVC